MTTRILIGNCLDILTTLDDASIQMCCTSPPYWGLRDYGVKGQLGLEPTPDEYVANMVRAFREVRRVLKDDGTLWLNIGDSYAGGGCGARDPERWPKQSRNDHMATHAKKRTDLKTKDLVGVPWMLAFALRADGWYLRSDIIWAKPNPMPESVQDRPTKAHEYLFLLSKSERYYYDAAAIAEPSSTLDTRRPYAPGQVDERGDGHARGGGSVRKTSGELRNKRTVWTIGTEPCADAHFAVMPSALVVPCILAGSRIGDTVLDPFGGSGTVGRVATELGRHSVLVELNPTYAAIADKRTAQEGLFATAPRPSSRYVFEDACPSDTCLMCTGEACALCGAGCSNTDLTRPRCDHDTIERHTEPSAHAGGA